MLWPRLADKTDSPLRIVVLVSAVFVSVLFPYKMLERTVDADLGAAQLVLHSVNVKEATFELMYKLRDIENVVLIQYTGAPPEDTIGRYETSRKRIPPLLDLLRELTLDNPQQQASVGAFATIVEGRTQLLDQAIERLAERNFDATGRILSQVRELFPYRKTAQEILDHEQALFERRSAEAEQAQEYARWGAFGAVGAQLLLLLGVTFLSERQVQRRLRAETHAQQAIERSRAVVQNVREPIILLDASLCVLMTNEAFRQVYGEGDRDEAGLRLDSLGNGAWNDNALMQRLADVAARDREMWDYELHQLCGGIERDMLINARRIVLPTSEEHGILVTVNDVTARKQSERQVLELNSELEARVAQVSEVNRELESFSYSVSHDLRAPLRHISGFADKLGSHLGDGADDKAHHYLEVIGSAARRMSQLIEDLLLYSRLGRNSLRLQPVDMQLLVDEVRAILASEAAGRDIEWRIGRLPIVIADESMMRQVWQNLLGNAVKYTSQRDDAVIEIDVEQGQPAEETVFHVRDNGVGFDMEYAGKLFGVFQRLHKASDFPGSGIGLANVRRMVGRHGGRTWAEATPGQGATFHFSLPALMAPVSNPERDA